MPGIYTHNVIFKKALEAASKKSGSSYINKSIVSLFNSPEHLKAGLFGSIGPNIFDYMDLRYRGKNYGNDISFLLHNEAGNSFAANMLEIIKGYKDSRNEWASSQRAYFMGYISHIIADSVIHPFVFYFSGFPVGGTRKEVIHFRKLNLLFQYNIDNYFLYKEENGVNPEIDEMLPVNKIGRRSSIEPSVKAVILQGLKKSDEGLFNRSFKRLEGKEINGALGYVPGFDRIPANIAFCYKMKRTENERLKRYMDRINDYPLLYSDFLVRYPGYKRVDMDALNIHQGRWQYPAGQKGIRYESVLHLIKTAVERIVEVWEGVEAVVYGEKSIDIAPFTEINAYTGEKGATYSEMQIKDVIKLRL